MGFSMNKLAISAIFTTTIAQAGSQETCLALALNGGGAKGAYQAGAIYGFMHEGNPADFEWDVVTGISGGAINTGAMAVWAPEDGLEMSEWLSSEWNNELRTHDVWKLWPGGVKAGLTTEPSLLDDTPLVDFLTGILGNFTEGVKRYSMSGTVDAKNADYHVFHLDEIPRDQLLDRGPKETVSSASLPGLFIPMRLDGANYVDGGTAMGLDAMSGVKKCLELVGGDESKITMDIMLLDRFVAPPEETEEDFNDKTIKNILRLHEMKSYYKGLENVITTMLAHPNVNYRYILEPSGKYPKLWNLLNFGPNNTWPLQQMGMDDAKTALENGEGHGFQKFHDYIATIEAGTATGLERHFTFSSEPEFAQ